MKVNKREKKREFKKLRQEIRDNYCISKMILVDDPELWCPAFPGNKIQANLGLFYTGTSISNTYLVVSGADDTALEIRHSSNNLDDLKNVWDKYKSIFNSIPEVTNFQWFLDRGFAYS